MKRHHRATFFDSPKPCRRLQSINGLSTFPPSATINNCILKFFGKISRDLRESLFFPRLDELSLGPTGQSKISRYSSIFLFETLFCSS